MYNKVYILFRSRGSGIVINSHGKLRMLLTAFHFIFILSYFPTQVNVGKMDSPIEKWNLIIGNLALKQVITHTVAALNYLLTLHYMKLLHLFSCHFYPN